MKLILCADDYGQSQGIDDAIIHLIQQKRLSATSCMTLSPRWKASAKRINSNIRNQAAIGLHLDFTHFGLAYSHPRLVILSILRLLNKKEIEQQIERQLDLFEEALGTSPDYIDGHQHIHQLPQIREVLIKVLLKRYQTKLPWLRIAKPPVADDIKGQIIRLLGANALKKLAFQAGLDYSDYLLGVYDFNVDTNNYISRMNAWLDALRKCSRTPVLMCHPSMAKAEQDPIYKARLNEFEALASNDFEMLLKKHTIELVTEP